jgi:hypothetical protein
MAITSEPVTGVTSAQVTDVTARPVTGVTDPGSRNGEDAPASVGRG